MSEQMNFSPRTTIYEQGFVWWACSASLASVQPQNGCACRSRCGVRIQTWCMHTDFLASKGFIERGAAQTVLLVDVGDQTRIVNDTSAIHSGQASCLG